MAGNLEIEIIGPGGAVTVDLSPTSTVPAAQQISCVVTPTYASIPANPTGFWVVTADETKAGNTTIYLFTPGVTIWFAAIKE
jgi:hypothetical protein